MRRNTRKSKLKLFLYVVLVIFIGGSYLFFRQVQKEYTSITTFEECVYAGYTVLPTYPEQCKIPGKIFTNNSQVATTDTVASTTQHKNMNPKNTTYDIEGQTVTLENGKAVLTSDQTEDFSSTTTIQYFGNELRIDIDGDTKEDTAFIVTSTAAGSGTFYYLVVAIAKNEGYSGTNGILLGDRIAPQTTEWRNGEIVVNYADRKPGDSMTTKPSVGVSRYFKINNDALVEIVK